MSNAGNITRVLVGLVIMSLLLPTSGLAQARVGVVATLEGTATVLRTSAPESVPLRFRDDVFGHDRIVVGAQSLIRLLLGGKATVTARERSVLTITDAPRIARINLSVGRIALAVSTGLLKAGEAVEFLTPHARGAIHGTVVVAEASADQSVITVLRGLIDVVRIDPATGRAVGHPVDVSAGQSLTVSGVSQLPLPPPTTISKAEAQSLSADFSVIPKRPPAVTLAPGVTESMVRAADDLAAVLPQTLGSSGGSSASSSSATQGTTSKSDGSGAGSGPGSGSIVSGSNPDASSGTLAPSGGNPGSGTGLPGRNGSDNAENANGKAGSSAATDLAVGSLRGSSGSASGNGLTLGNTGTNGAVGNARTLGSAGTLSDGSGTGRALGNGGGPGNSDGTPRLGPGTAAKNVNLPVDVGNKPSLATSGRGK